jgi:hypothetical protein
MRDSSGAKIAGASAVSGAAFALPPIEPGIAPSTQINKTKKERQSIWHLRNGSFRQIYSNFPKTRRRDVLLFMAWLIVHCCGTKMRHQNKFYSQQAAISV